MQFPFLNKLLLIQISLHLRGGTVFHKYTFFPMNLDYINAKIRKFCDIFGLLYTSEYLEIKTKQIS